MKPKTTRRMTKVIDSYGNIFRSYREASRFWGLAPNTIKNDCNGSTGKGLNFKRKIRFRRVKK